ncbi:hypothetical protein ABGB18_04915 [Nonomuraea sp. B12E4]|uniref:hypothetical protein n=1 Tax=Nonomuraea sp. B12E4 TaxID=3153564 RepID=UPI00325F7CF3
MDHTRKMWASAAVVGVIVVGGASIAAAASAGKLEEVRAVMEKAPPTPRPSDSRSVEDDDEIVVSTEVNPDPGKVFEYWTDSRMEDAQPMPMPSVDRLQLPE